MGLFIGSVFLKKRAEQKNRFMMLLVLENAHKNILRR